MRISVVAVGTRMPAWVIQGVEEYSKRMPRELKPLWREIPLARRAKDTAGDQACVAEGDQILKAISRGGASNRLRCGGQAYLHRAAGRATGGVANVGRQLQYFDWWARWAFPGLPSAR